MTDTRSAWSGRAPKLLLWSALAALAVLLGAAVLSLPGGGGLAEQALAGLDRTGVSHPVTAVLMNYRAYDTLLEIAVLFLAMLGVWSMAEMPQRPASRPGLVLEFLNQILVPFLILFAGYLIWAGAHQPGGAFQAGAVLAGAGVLVTLSKMPLPALPLAVYRLLLILGLATFVVIGVAVQIGGGRFLELQPPAAKVLILVIEIAAGISIGLCLAAIFRGGRPHAQEVDGR